MGRCSAHNCTNSDDNGFTIHGFPADKRLRLQWAANINNSGPSGPPTAKGRHWVPGPGAYHSICEAHFTEDQFEPSTKRLKPNAVPTIFATPRHNSRTSKGGKAKPEAERDTNRKVVFDYWHNPANWNVHEMPRMEKHPLEPPDDMEIEEAESGAVEVEVLIESASESELDIADLDPKATDGCPNTDNPYRKTNKPNPQTRYSYWKTDTSLTKTVIGVPAEAIRILRPIAAGRVRASDSIRLDLEQEVTRLRRQLERRSCELVKLRKANAGMRAKLFWTNSQLEESLECLGSFLPEDQIRHLRSKSVKGRAARRMKTESRTSYSGPKSSTSGSETSTCTHKTINCYPKTGTLVSETSDSYLGTSNSNSKTYNSDSSNSTYSTIDSRTRVSYPDSQTVIFISKIGNPIPNTSLSETTSNPNSKTRDSYPTISKTSKKEESVSKTNNSHPKTSNHASKTSTSLSETCNSYSKDYKSDSQTASSLPNASESSPRTSELPPAVEVPEMVRIPRPIVDWSVRTPDSIRVNLEQEVTRLRHQLKKRRGELVKVNKANAGTYDKLHQTNAQLRETLNYLGSFLLEDEMGPLRSKANKCEATWCMGVVVEDSKSADPCPKANDSQTGTSLPKTGDFPISLDLEQEVVRLRQDLDKYFCELVKQRKGNAGMHVKLYRAKSLLRESLAQLSNFLRDNRIQNLPVPGADGVP